MNRFLLLCLLLLILLTACGKKAEKGIALAQVNKEILYLENFKATFGVEEWDALNPELRKKYIEDWVNLTVLAQYADEQNLNKSLAVRQKMDYAAKKIKANALITQRLAQVQVSEDQMFNYFRLHQANFQKNAVEYNIQRIALKDKLNAENVMTQLNQGMSFNEAVQRYSSEELKAKNGFMGFISSAGADSSFWLAARNLPEKGFGLINKDQLWFIFRILEERTTSQEANFEDYRAEIKRKVILEKQDQIYQELIKEVKSQTGKIFYY